MTAFRTRLRKVQYKMMPKNKEIQMKKEVREIRTFQRHTSASFSVR